MPLTFITGFLGQSFGWMVWPRRLEPRVRRAGIGLQAGVVLLFAYFKREGWF